MPQSLLPNSDISNPGGWAPTPLWSNINDFSDSTTIGASGSGNLAFIVGLTAGVTPSAGTSSIMVRAKKNNSSGQNRHLRIQILDSANNVIEVFKTPDLQDTFQNYGFVVTATISDYSSLRVRIVDRESDSGSTRNAIVAWAELKIPDAEAPTGGCEVSLRNQLAGSDSGGTWTYLGYSTAPESTPGSGGSDPGTLIGDNPIVNFQSFISGFYHFKYCGQSGSCEENCEDLIVQVVSPVNCSSTPTNNSDTYCEGDLSSYNLYTLLGINESSSCRIASAISTGSSEISPSDIIVSGSTAIVNLSSYAHGVYVLTVITRTSDVLDYELHCEECYHENTITFTIESCEQCEVSAGEALATQVCYDDGPQVISLRNRLLGADAGGEWNYLGYNETTPGSPGAGGSSVGTLTGDNPGVDFEGFTPGFYHFEYCVENTNLENCEDCETLIIEVIECQDPCEEVSAGEAINTTICN